MAKISAICAAAAALVSTLSCADVLRDPTAPINYVPKVSVPDGASKSSGGLALNAIFLNSPARAIISGNRVGVGDEVDGYKVTGIFPGRVELSRNDEKITLKMHADVLKAN